MATECPWCGDDNDDTYSPQLCEWHRAEHEGMTLHTMAERLEYLEYLEFLDTTGLL